jgi:hypothetical protein
MAGLWERVIYMSALPRESGDPGVLSKGAWLFRKSLDPRLRGEERREVAQGRALRLG